MDDNMSLDKKDTAIKIDYELLVKRIVAAFIDMIIISVPILIIYSTIVILALIARAFDALVLKQFLLYFAAFASSVVSFSYVLLKDGVVFGHWFENRSFGKKVMKLQIVCDNKSFSPIQYSIKRNSILSVGCFVPVIGSIPFVGTYLSFIVSLCAGSIIIGEVYALCKNPEQRRWGDKQASTRVILEPHTKAI